jgi:hypothetical protein
MCKHCEHELIPGFKQKQAEQANKAKGVVGCKQCPGCEEFVGVKTYVCKKCGHEFKKKVKKEKEPVKTYKEYEKGRKECPGCKFYVAQQTQTCACGHKFEKPDSKQILEKVLSGDLTEEEARQQIESQKVKVYDTGGRGRKQCPQCRKFVGYSAEYCGCGLKFGKYQPPKKKANGGQFAAPVMVDLESSQFQRAMGTQSLLVIAPSGICPCKLTGIDYDSVKAWAEKVVEAGEQLDKCYSPAALRYFAREFGALIDFDVFSEKYETVCGHITQWSQQLCEGY